MNILILGGTSDARKVVKGLDQQGLLGDNRVIYSVAGLVRIPQLPCEVISGGFSQYGGLETYLKEEQIGLLLDVTHPFAETMSTTAVNAAKQLGIPCWRFHREAWQAQQGDKWRSFADMQSLVAAAESYKSVLLTAGQLSQAVIDQFGVYAQRNGQNQVFRTAAPAQAELPESMQWLKAIGPFNHQDEKALLAHHQIDLLISKNSGGAATEAKLSAARELGVDVFMLERPELPEADRIFREIDGCVEAVRTLVNESR
ncbi:precorrin-6A/cobalt-precorrin-6A reductase [Neptuniibacter sp. PT34_22]|uniref:precorrin-6A/cobalt-precorrin-6A reductase n=1 Tax=Neptuniibacter sp. PT34_22 TaxID=3398205 RepID=UPI0039F5EBA0